MTSTRSTTTLAWGGGAFVPATSCASHITFVGCVGGNHGIPPVDLHRSVDCLAVPGEALLLCSQGTGGGGRFHVGHEAKLRAGEEVELWSRLLEEFSRLRREDEARTAAGVGSLASLVSRPAAENLEEGSADLE